MGSSASTHAKAASASTGSSINKGKKMKQQIGVSGQACMKSDSKKSSHNNGTDVKLTKISNVDKTKSNVQVGQKGLEDKYVMLDNEKEMTSEEHENLVRMNLIHEDEETSHSLTDDSDSDDDSDDESDEEDVEYDEEVARILEDAKKLKILAQAFLHPEKPVVTEPTAFARNYFNRPSAPETEDDEYADERAEILEEMKALKKLAVDYMHPEIGVKTTDPTAFGRDYFNRPSAPETEDEEYANERAQALADAAALKKLAVDYMHPEIGVKTTDPTAFGRNCYGLDVHEIHTEETHPDEDDESYGSHDHHMFEFEEHEVDYSDMRATLSAVVPMQASHFVPVKQEGMLKHDEEGSLSRSPSSVMLFGLE